MFKHKKLTFFQFLLLNTVVITFIFAGIFYFIWIKYEHKRFHRAINESEKMYLESRKQALKTVVEQFYNNLLLNYKSKKEIFKKQIDSLLVAAEYPDTVGNLKKLCFSIKKDNEALNFVFIKNGKEEFSSVNKPLNKLKESEEFSLFKEKYLKKLKGKLYVFILKKDFDRVIKASVLALFKDISFNYSGYLFIVDTDGTILLSAHKLMNEKIEAKSKKFGKKTQSIILNKAKKEGKGFVEYTWFKPDLKKVCKKISYLKLNKELNWIIGAGIYLDDIKASFMPVYRESEKDFHSNIVKVSFLIFIIILLDLGLFVLLVGDKFKSDFERLNELFDRFAEWSIEDIDNFKCDSLTFRETCQFAQKIKKNLIDIKRTHEKLKKTNTLLEETSEKFSKLAKHINRGIAIVDEALSVEFANREFCNIFECGIDKTINANFLQFFPPEERRKLTSNIERILVSSVDEFSYKMYKVEVGGKEKYVEVSFARLILKENKKVICTVSDVTEKQKILEHLKFLTVQFEKAEEMAKVGNWIYYPEEKRFWASKEAFKIYDIDLNEKNEINLATVNSRILEEDKDIAYLTTVNPIKYKKVFEGTFRVKDRAGNVKYIISRGEPVLDGKGVVRRVEGVLKDITDLKKTENELQKHIELLERTQMIAQLGYWEYNFKKEEFLFFSSFFSSVFGKDTVGKYEVISLVVEEEREKIKDLFKKEFRKNGYVSGTVKVVLPGADSCRFIYFESEGKYEVDGHFKRSGWAQDITGLKELEREIEAEKNKLINTINVLTEGVAVIDKQLNFVFVNSSFKKIFRIENVGGENIKEFFKKFNISGFPEKITKKNIKSVMSRETKYTLSFDDAEIVLNFEVKELEKEGEFIGYVLVVEDITHKEKYTEEVIKSENMRLLNKIAASLAHDLNNLLGSILGKVSILEKEAKDLKISRDMSKIMRHINIAKALATQFLTFSKSGKPLLKNIEKSTLRQIIQDLGDFVFSGTPVDVSIDIEDNLMAIKGDNTQIAQIILNLFSNARDVLGEGGQIKVEVKNVRDEVPVLNCKKGDYVLLKISDNGPGITEDKLNNIFEFFVGYKKEGFGLGLAIVKNIVDSHKGCLDVKSSPGQGTTFYVYLPAAETSEEDNLSEMTVSSEPKKDKKTINVPLEKLRIAVLEDERSMQETIYDLMKFIGVDGEIFSRGEELIEAVKARKKKGERYHMAILDLTIRGGMGGKEVVKKIKEIDSRILAIVSSGYSKDPIVSKYAEFGFDGALPKPYSLDDFENLFNNFLKK